MDYQGAGERAAFRFEDAPDRGLIERICTQAINGLGRKCDQAPLAQEFGLFVKEAKLGVPIEEALVNMAKRVGSDDPECVVDRRADVAVRGCEQSADADAAAQTVGFDPSHLPTAHVRSAGVKNPLKMRRLA